MIALALTAFALLHAPSAGVNAEVGRARTKETAACAFAKLPPTANAYLDDIASQSANDAMAVGFIGGANTVTYAMHWNGTSWSVVATPNHLHYTNGWIAAVASIPGTDQYWAVGVSATGDDDATLILRWNGSSWVSGGPVVQGVWLTAVTALSADDAWSVGFLTNGGNGVPVAFHWNGVKWTRVSVPRALTGGSGLDGVAARSPDDVWAVGTEPNAGLIERWNGRSWSVVASPDAGYLWSVSAVPGAHEVWAVGNTFDEWNGRAWRVQSGDPGGLVSILAIAPDDVWAAGAMGAPSPSGPTKPLLMRWNGARWLTIPTKDPNSRSDTSLFGLARTFIRGGVWVAGTSSTGEPTEFIEACH